MTAGDGGNEKGGEEDERDETTKIKISPLAKETSYRERRREKEHVRDRKEKKDTGMELERSKTRSPKKSRIVPCAAGIYMFLLKTFASFKLRTRPPITAKKSIYDSLSCYIAPLFFPPRLHMKWHGLYNAGSTARRFDHRLTPTCQASLLKLHKTARQCG